MATKPELPEVVKNILSIMAKSMSSVKELDGKYLVESSKGDTWYLVDLNSQTCDCAAGLNHQKCYHLDVAAAFRDAKKRRHAR